jgi:hypothetical protein
MNTDKWDKKTKKSCSSNLSVAIIRSEKREIWRKSLSETQVIIAGFKNKSWGIEKMLKIILSIFCAKGGNRTHTPGGTRV